VIAMSVLETEDMARFLLEGGDILLECLKAKFERENMMDFALHGDWGPLTDYLKGRGRITSEMRSFLVEILSGTRRRPAKKISVAKTDLRNAELVQWVRDARRRGEKDIPKQAVEKFGRNWRNLQKILASQKWRETCLDKIEIWEQLLQDGRAYNATRGVTKYRVNAMALTPHTLT
jgi:hypothetical protein